MYKYISLSNLWSQYLKVMSSCHRKQFSSKADSSALNVGTLFLLRFPFVEKEQGQFRLGTSDMTWGDQQNVSSTVVVSENFVIET